MIPKKIHYCWFGGKPIPEQAKKCIESWKKFCPDYEIIEWNENNYDLNKNDYVKYTYEHGKYAFLSDYVRLDVIYNEGGIYLDTDVELIRPLDELLQHEAFMGMERTGIVNTGLGFGSEKYQSIIKENKEYYENYVFLDENGNFKPAICVDVTSNLLKKYGLKEANEIQNLFGLLVYPTEYFCPLDYTANKLCKSSETYSIHWYSGSWMTLSGKIKLKSGRILYKILGEKWYKKLKYKITKHI